MKFVILKWISWLNSTDEKIVFRYDIVPKIEWDVLNNDIKNSTWSVMAISDIFKEAKTLIKSLPKYELRVKVSQE